MTRRKRTSFHGQVVIVTVGGSGIGRATAGGFADRGASVMVVEVDQAAAKRLSELKTPGSAVRADVSDSGQVAALIAATVAAHGRLDVLVNNAGFGVRGTMATRYRAQPTQHGTRTH